MAEQIVDRVEIRIKRKELEAQIKEAITKFEDETGLYIESLDMDRRQSAIGFPWQLDDVSANVRIGK